MAIAAIEPDTEQSSDSTPPQKPASWGQFLLPLLFAAMETCWIDAIFIGLANADALGTTHLLFPLWLPFVLIGSFYVLTSYQRWYAADGEQPLPHKEKRITSAHLATISLTAIATLFMVWISYYAPLTAFTDPNWLLNLPSTIMQLNPDSFRLIGIIALAIAFCRQGTLLVRGRVDHALISKLLQSGIFTFIILLVIRKFLEVTGRVFDDGWTVLFLIVLYLCLSLATHALARVGVVRRCYSVGQRNDLIRQERVTLQSVVLASSILLAIALGTGAILNATIIGDTGVLFYKSNSFIIPPLGKANIPALCRASCATSVTHKNVPAVHQPSNTLLTSIIFVLFIILLLAIVVFALLLVIQFIRRWRKREKVQQRWELHESLWSWLLFWEQFKNFMHALLKRLTAFTRHSTQVARYSLAIDRQLPSTHNIYEIYRFLLIYAANLGYPRANYETPNEFSLRLAQHYPLLEAHFVMITSAYVTTRYAGTILPPNDVSATQDAWTALRQQWQ